MFIGTLPTDARAAIAPILESWKCADLAFPCSGNFTIARSLGEAPGGPRLHGNDVSLYTCALGWYLAGVDPQIAAKEEADLVWMDPFMKTPVGRTAAVLTWSSYADTWVKRGKTPYHARMANAARTQFPQMHAKVVSRLEGTKTRLTSFYAGDCMEFLELLPPGTAVVSFPPAYVGGYEAMYKSLEACFEWKPPDYGRFEFDPFIAKVLERDRWILGAQTPLEALEERCVGRIRATNRTPPIHLYASTGERKCLVMPRQRAEPLFIPKLGEHEIITGPLEVRAIDNPAFNALRSQFLNVHIAPAGAQLPYGVFAGGKLIGCLAFTVQSRGVPAELPTPSVYMLTDFAIRPTRYPRLSKLVLAAALSRECQLLLERASSRRFRSVITTAFCQNPVSMKYRGVMKLLTRKEEKGTEFKWKLNYGATLGQHTLAEAFERWRKDAGRD